MPDESQLDFVGLFATLLYFFSIQNLKHLHVLFQIRNLEFLLSSSYSVGHQCSTHLWQQGLMPNICIRKALFLLLPCTYFLSHSCTIFLCFFLCYLFIITLSLSFHPLSTLLPSPFFLSLLSFPLFSFSLHLFLPHSLPLFFLSVFIVFLLRILFNALSFSFSLSLSLSLSLYLSISFSLLHSIIQLSIL